MIDYWSFNAYGYVDLEDLRRYNRQMAELTIRNFRSDYIAGLDSLFFKGYISLRTWLLARTTQGYYTRFSRIINLLVQKIKRIVI